MVDGQGPLSGITVLDLSRILAAPTCTQLLGDLGAEVIKIEAPGKGDDTRNWGPPFLHDADGNETDQSAYFLSSNRNKRSVTVNLAHAQGQKIMRDLAAQADILIENFKVGGLAKYGLAYADLAASHPHLIYCSLTGFGQTGPYAPRPGYDFIVQGMGGMMSLTGEPDGQPMKVGVGIADVMCGMYAASAILACLHERQASGQGQHIDIGLLDSQVAWLINEGCNYLVSGDIPQRRGNAHPNIVPYEAFEASDGWIILAVGNNGQFERFLAFAGAPELATDPRFATNDLRVRNRLALIPLVAELVKQKTQSAWLDGLASRNVPCGPVNNLEQVFTDEHILARDMRIEMNHPYRSGETVSLIGNPLKLSRTPVTYRQPPPRLGEHTDIVLEQRLGLDTDARAALRADGVI